MDPDDGTIGQKLGENAERNSILGIVERRDEDSRIGAVEVGVTGGKPDAVEIEWGGHWEVDHLDARPSFQVHALQALAVLC